MIRLFTSCALVLTALRCHAAPPPAVHYVGPETCALCHRAIADQQNQTAMANTWHQPQTSWLAPDFEASVDDDIQYTLRRTNKTFSYTINLGSTPITLPISILMGGRRHGLGFLAPIDHIDGMALARRALVQARYAWSMDHRKLLIAPGSAVTRPATVEAALGLALSPNFETRCVACHGQPNVDGSGKSGGVHCESCHGPGSAHLQNVSAIINPRRLSNEESIQVCARCHIGLTKFSDPSPQDLLVANQVVAIKSSECYLQSRKGFSCTTCHNPHSDSTDDSRAIKACVGCHSASMQTHAAICPVNSTGDCVRCHMPSVEMGPLHLVDHSIRVHPEQTTAVLPRNPELRSRWQPVSEYLRVINVSTSQQASEAERRLQAGESFYEVARTLSQGPTASIGGYLGRKTLAELTPKLSQAAVGLDYGASSQIIHDNERFAILQRLPRDFRWQAEKLQTQAEALGNSGKMQSAIELSQQSLKIYPHFLRAIAFIGLSYAQAGNVGKGTQVLSTAAKLYPDDATVRFELGVLQESQGDVEAAAASYRRAIELDGDLTAAYLRLGELSNSIQDWQTAATTFRAGLRIDPLNCDLYRGLALALEKTGDESGAKQAGALSAKLSVGRQ